MSILHRFKKGIVMGGRAGGAMVRTAWHRARRGPQQPHWSFAYQATLLFLRESFAREGASLDKARQTMDRLGRRGRKRFPVRWQPTTLGGVPAEWVTVAQPDDHVVVYLHGGGFAFGSVDSHAGLIGTLATTTRARVLAVLYRLAPEHPCPAAIDDVVAVWRAMLDAGTDPRKVTFAGDSAGAGLAMSSMVALRDAGLPLPAGAVLLSPWADLAMTTDSSARNHPHDYLGTQEGLRAFARHYTGALSVTDPRVSVIHADLRGLPPLLILTGGAEILLDDSVRLAERARAAGVETTLIVEPGEVHVYVMFDQLSDAARRGWQAISAFITAP